MTREEIRLAFRQAPEEEFAAVPQQPAIHASPQFQKKMGRMLGMVPARITKTKRLTILLLAAVLLILGACTVYQAFTNGAYIKLFGPYTNFKTHTEEYHYLTRGYQGDRDSIPHYSLPTPEGFVQIYDGSYLPDDSYEYYDQWWDPDTGDRLTLTQTALALEPELEVDFALQTTEQDGITVFYGCREDAGFAFWLNGDTAFILDYRGTVTDQQLLQWVQSMDYTPYFQELDPETVSDYYCYLDDYYDWESGSDLPIGMKFYYGIWDEVYERIEEEETGRHENIDYNFSSAPEGFTLIKTENNTDVGPTGHLENSFRFATNGATYTYENEQGVQLVLDQCILDPIPECGTCWPGIASFQPMEEVRVLDMAGLYSQEPEYSQLYWLYGGRLMWIYYYGEISKEELIAMAETVDYENGIEALPALEETEDSGSVD